MSNDLSFYLALWLAPDVGPRTFAEILTAAPDLAEVFKQANKWKTKLNLSNATVSYLNSPNWQAVEQHLAWQAQAANRYIISLLDPLYPKELREISDPPPILLAEGDVSLLNDPSLAIVGSRRMTAYGKDNAFQFAKHLAEAGLNIVSGLASGIDTAAHLGALAAKNGKTIAVLGTGIDLVYPPQNRELAQKIQQHGLLIAELPLATPASKYTFPRRNRIITGMSLGVLVVEAALQSGSLISARLALDQGREVFAIPNSIHSPMSKGCHQLLRTGAKLVESSLDILTELKPYLENTLNNKNLMTELSKTETFANDDKLDQEYEALLAHIGFDTTPADVIIARSQLTPQVVSSMLLMLELEGYIAGVPGGYIRIR